jgi:tRNA1Val (adenine37-N6)-methyltransferase
MSHFKFKQFTVWQNHNAMKVCTDACLFGAWAAEELAPTLNADNTILDIGTGTGLLSLLLAQKINAKIIALEINPAAAAEASSNISLAGKENQIEVINTALQNYKSTFLFDAIICNPPFFKQSLKSPDSAKNLVLHEDNLPLKYILHFIKEKLSASGSAVLLLPASRKEEVLNIIKKENLFLEKLVEVRQTPAHAPFRLFLKIGKEKKLMTTKDLIIKSGDAYTAGFIYYLKDYYLYL